MSALERGFKAWSERTALAFRSELKVNIDAALSPTLLADYLGVQLWTPHQVPGMTSDLLDQLLENDPWGWSATSLQVDGTAIIIFNPRHSKGRQASDVAHELAHII